MSIITDIDEETEDIIWVAVDGAGEIALFFSGGRGFVPPSVKQSREDLELITGYFSNELERTGEAVESQTLCNHAQFASDRERMKYLRGYLSVSCKGVYTFDCILGPNRPSGYHKVASPVEPLTINNVPVEIADHLLRTRFPPRFRDVDRITVCAIE